MSQRHRAMRQFCDDNPDKSITYSWKASNGNTQSITYQGGQHPQGSGTGAGALVGTPAKSGWCLRHDAEHAESQRLRL
jgi:hypothetical protein